MNYMFLQNIVTTKYQVSESTGSALKLAFKISADRIASAPFIYIFFKYTVMYAKCKDN